MSQILIGNIISFVSAMFMAASCLADTKYKIFFYQVLECLVLAVASVFFGSLAGAVTLVLCALRNYIIARERFSMAIMWLFVILTIVSGVWVNNLGLLGLIPVIATVEYTICCHYITSVKGTKYSIFVNVLLWVIYSFMIYDFSTGIADTIVLIVDAAAIVRMRHSSQPAEHD